MELFATDRDRLAFLLETDAALDLDFETLEALAGEVPEEQPSEKRPKYITNYIGSKHLPAAPSRIFFLSHCLPHPVFNCFSRVAASFRVWNVSASITSTGSRDFVHSTFPARWYVSRFCKSSACPIYKEPSEHLST